MPELTGDELSDIAWLVVYGTGHFPHGAWTVDSRDMVLMCACGTALLRLEAVGQ